MNTELILKADLLDILFQNRNKEYGAYALRKSYPERVKTSLMIMFFGAAAISAFTFIPSGNSILPIHNVEEYTLRQATVENTVEPPKPKPRLKSDYKIPSQKKFVAGFIVVPDKDSTEKFDDLSKLMIGDKTVINTTDGLADAKIGRTGGEGTNPEPVPAALPEVNKAGPVDNPDIQASFPGGQKELIRFLERNLRSPNEIDEGQTIQVQVKFIVDFDGGLQSFEVVKDGGEAFNKEVVRVLKKMPRWNPGKKGGQNIPVYYTIPVKFTSNE